MKKMGLLGGTFDPIHQGHIEMMERLEKALDLDGVVLMPTFVPPHKIRESMASGQHRLAMCRMAAEGHPTWQISDLELTREGASFTVVTLTTLCQQSPDTRWYLITGADMFMTFDQWYRFDDLKKLVTVCTVPRDDVSIEQLELRSAELREMGCDTFVSDWRPVDISSTLIRSRAAEGLSLEELVPAKVEEYIREHGLYR